MAFKEIITERIEKLLKEVESLKKGSEHGQVRSEEYQQQCAKWIYEAERVVNLVEPDPENRRRKVAKEYTEGPIDYYNNLLYGLRFDIGFGYISTISERAYRKALDNFLDYAKVHLIEGNIRVSGAIAGVVFEDCLRRVSSKAGIYEEGHKLGSLLIRDLVSLHKFSETKARLARIAVQVRTKAILTQCDGFNEKEVGVAIDFTRELISDYFDTVTMFACGQLRIAVTEVVRVC